MQDTQLYISEIQSIKSAILQSRYRAASLANRELLSLYFAIGEFVSINSRNNNWGKGAIETISAKLQQELPGLRGFSATNIKNMRIFYEEWREHIPVHLIINPIGNIERETDFEFRQLPTDDLAGIKLECFFKIGFTHHLSILYKLKSLEERLFYIEQCASRAWSIEQLKFSIKSKLFSSIGELQTNFANTIENTSYYSKAINSFRDELLLDFVNINDADEELDERVLEHSIVNNIKKFIMALGTDFCFIGNQYRLIIEGDEFFIDLLFFNRKLQSLVAIELKTGKFKAEYAGKMNLYLSALDEYIKQEHENPSIGIILCKEKNNKVVEFAFRDTNKPMGVAIYKTASELPLEYRNILPNAEELKQLI